MAINKELERKGTEDSARNQARRDRTRFAGPRRRLQIDESRLSKEYFYRWFNDDNDELGQAERAGYTYVKKDEIGDLGAVGDREVDSGNTDLNSNVSRVVGRDRGGKPMRAYFMKLPMQLYKEDQEWREREVNAKVDESIHRGTPGQSARVENSYGLKVDYRTGR